MADPLALVDTRAEYEHVFGIYVPIAVGVFCLVLVAVLAAVLVYRRRPPDRAARWSENNRVEGAYALVLALVIGFLVYVTFKAEHRVDTVAARQRPSLTVDVYGAEWEWHFHYPQYGIDRYSGTVGHQTLVVPTGQAIRFDLISRDVIHEFWIPELRYKHDLIPGSVQRVTLVFSRPGTFPGQCSEFCGLYHSRMLFTVVAVSPARFAAWAAAERAHRASAAGGGAAA